VPPAATERRGNPSRLLAKKKGRRGKRERIGVGYFIIHGTQRESEVREKEKKGEDDYGLLDLERRTQGHSLLIIPRRGEGRKRGSSTILAVSRT